jgi:hypothetical protein
VVFIDAWEWFLHELDKAIERCINGDCFSPPRRPRRGKKEHGRNLGQSSTPQSQASDEEEDKEEGEKDWVCMDEWRWMEER